MRGETLRLSQSAVPYLGLPYGAGEAASAWGLGSRMVAGNTHTHSHAAIYIAKTRQKWITSLLVAMQQQQQQKKQVERMQTRRRLNKADDKTDKHLRHPRTKSHGAQRVNCLHHHS